MSIEHFVDGGYRYIPGVFQYSAGVVAQSGMRIERAVFSNPIPLAAGFDLIEKHLAALGRPNTAFCACELRSPKPFTEQGFRDFNLQYGAVLERWGVLRDGVNPVARSNVCPELDKPGEPSFYAFSYTVTDASAAPTFVVAGSGESPEGKGDYRDNLIARGDLSASGLQAKVRYVLGEMQRRLNLLGFDWPATTGVQVYSVHDFHALIAKEIEPSGAMRTGLTWHYARPPVQELEYEMDCRGLSNEIVIQQ